MLIKIRLCCLDWLCKRRDQIIAGFFEDQEYDYEELNRFLKKCGETPISVRVHSLDV